MAEDSHLYELVWGEPVPAPASPNRPPAAEPEPLRTQSEPEQRPNPPGQSPQEDVAARLEVIEGSMLELLQAVESMRSSAMYREMVLISLEALESRLGRMEKGLVRSLEHLESMITESRRH